MFDGLLWLVIVAGLWWNAILQGTLSDGIGDDLIGRKTGSIGACDFLWDETGFFGLLNDVQRDDVVTGQNLLATGTETGIGKALAGPHETRIIASSPVETLVFGWHDIMSWKKSIKTHALSTPNWNKMATYLVFDGQLLIYHGIYISHKRTSYRIINLYVVLNTYPLKLLLNNLFKQAQAEHVLLQPKILSSFLLKKLNVGALLFLQC